MQDSSVSAASTWNVVVLRRVSRSRSTTTTANGRKQIAKYPWFEKKRPWQREIKKMLDNDFKLEVEALISKDISYVTEDYVPERLEATDWLD